jgi:hypothetical protein
MPLRETVHETLSPKQPTHKKRTGGVAQGVGPKFKPPVLQKKKKEEENGLTGLRSVAQVVDYLPHKIKAYGVRVE